MSYETYVTIFKKKTKSYNTYNEKMKGTIFTTKSNVGIYRKLIYFQDREPHVCNACKQRAEQSLKSDKRNIYIHNYVPIGTITIYE